MRIEDDRFAFKGSRKMACKHTKRPSALLTLRASWVSMEQPCCILHQYTQCGWRSGPLMNAKRHSFNCGVSHQLLSYQKGTHTTEAPIRRKYHKDEYDIMLLRRGQVTCHFQSRLKLPASRS
jgi:hypothetical protein